MASLGVLTTGSSDAGAAGNEEADRRGLLKVVEKADEKHLLWQPIPELTVRLLPPSLTL